MHNPYPLSGESDLHGSRRQAQSARLFPRGQLVGGIDLRHADARRVSPCGCFLSARGADVHVALAVVEDLMSGTKLEAYLAAPEGVSGSVVLDIGMVEV